MCTGTRRPSEHYRNGTRAKYPVGGTPRCRGRAVAWMTWLGLPDSRGSCAAQSVCAGRRGDQGAANEAAVPVAIVPIARRLGSRRSRTRCIEPGSLRASRYRQPRGSPTRHGDAPPAREAAPAAAAGAGRGLRAHWGGVTVETFVAVGAAGRLPRGSSGMPMPLCRSTVRNRNYVAATRPLMGIRASGSSSGTRASCL